MSTREEIMHLEGRLRQAELGPDPAFFEEHLADDAVLDGQRLKPRVVEAHRPGSGKGCEGFYEGPQFSGTRKFMRVWLERGGRWQIIAGSTLK